MQNSHNSPKCAKTHENDNLELIFLFAQLDKDLLTIQHHFYRFWHHNLPDIDKKKKKTMYFFQIFLFYIFHENWSLTCKDVLH